MKKSLLFLALILCFYNGFAQIPTVKIYQLDGNDKSYSLSNIENISFKSLGYSNLSIFFQKSQNDIYPTSKIDSINFKSINDKISGLVIFLNGQPSKEYTLMDIDSIVFTQVPVPNITSILPIGIQIGDVMTIFGKNFGGTRGTSTVTFAGVLATEFVSWSDTKIEVKVPKNSVSGKLSVTVNSLKSNDVDYTIVVAPSITNINPTSFAVGDSVTINGTNFGATQGSSYVTFNKADAIVIKLWSSTKIICIAPIGASTGNLSVDVNSVKSNDVKFTLTGSIQTVLIPAGTFKMGNTGTYSGITFISEQPVHDVTISNSFYMGKYEVSQALYTSVMGTNPSNLKAADHPVERLSWYDGVAFCNKLSDRDGFKKCYTINGTSVTCDWTANGWRLPTEAEWEYACKAGTSSDYYSGNNESDLATIAWYSGNSGDSTHIPGLKKPNKFGLYDIIGNVFEWVWDWSGPYPSGPVTDPTGPTSGTVKIIRGGSWHNGLPNGMSRSSFRGWEDNPAGHSSTDGIRLVRIQ